MPHGMRATSTGLMVGFSIYTQVLVNKLRRAREALREACDELGFRIMESITKLAQENENLRRSETHFCTIVGQLPLSIQILSPDGRTLWINRASEELWGVTLDDVAGYNLLEDQQLVAEGIMPYIQRGLAGEPTLIPPIVYDPDETIPGLTGQEEPKRWVRASSYPATKDEGPGTYVRWS
jgi:PAS domain-containing protein